MDILEKPSSFTFAGNAPDIVVRGSDIVDFVLSLNGEKLLSEKYHSHQGYVTIPLRHVLERSTPKADVNAGNIAIPRYSYTINGGAAENFFCISGGHAAAVDAFTFLNNNWLTWQPQSKAVSFNSPEVLVCATTSQVNIMVKGYLSDDKTSTVVHQVLASGRIHTVDVMYSKIADSFSERPLFFDIWFSGDNFSSYTQRYYLTSDNRQIDIFQWNNSIGGVDTVSFVGDKLERLNSESSVFELVDENVEYDLSSTKSFTKYTGYIDKESTRLWILDFFNSTCRYHLDKGMLRRVVVSKPKLENIHGELAGYEFEFAHGSQTIYLNITRFDAPEILDVVAPDGEVFFLAPRLSEFSSANINAGEILVPCQYSSGNEWHYIAFSDMPSAKPGKPGESIKGDSGKSTYLHVKYSNDGGVTLTANEGDDIGEWLGQCVTFDVVGPLDPLLYKWSRTKGEIGAPGDRTAQVLLYIRSNAVPLRPTGNVFYTFKDQKVTGAVGDWVNQIPEGDSPIYVIAAMAYGNSDVDTIEYSEWSEPVVLAQNGSGLNTAPVKLYARGIYAPSMPQSELIYTFATASLNSLPIGWWPIEPATNGEPLWMTAAMAVSPSESDTIESSEWSTPVKILQDGEPGTAGAKTATVMLYLRSEGVPSRPPDWVTYFFDTQSVGGYRGEWKDKIPDGDLPIYVIGAIAYSEIDNDIIYPNEWSEPVVLAQNGSGINTAAVRLYARGAVPPSMPNVELLYTFATASLNYLPFGWWPTEPATNGEPLWMIAAMAVSPSDSDTIEASEWSTPVKILQDGAPAPLLKSQFSVDGISGWHDEPQPGDAYRRDSNDNGLTWSKPYRIRGEDGVLGINLLRSIPWALRNSTTAVYVIEKSRYPELFGVAVTFKLHQFIYDFSRMWIEEYDSLGNQTRSPSQWDQSQHLTLSTSIHSSSMCIVVQTNYMDVPKLIKAKLEQGSVATPWSVSEEDRKQIELEIRAVTDNFTAQDGGMLMTSLIKLLNSGREMAGFSGLGTGADPALWIGGTYADALANNTSVVMRAHGGSKIGTFSIDDKGLGAFTNQSDKRWMMLYDDLVPEMEYFLGQPYNDTYQHDASQIFVPQFNIESQYLTTIYLGWNKLSAVELKTSITLYAYEPNPTVHGGTVTASVYLTATSGNILIGTYSHSVGTYAKPGDQAQDYRTFPIVYSSNALPKRGRIIVKYSMTASHYPTGGYYDDFRGSVQLMNATAMTSWNLKSFVGKGLAMFVDNNNYIHFGYNNETGSVAEPRRLTFRMKSYEDPDMPGVLASCRIEENGKINRNLSYGSKISLLNDGIRDSNGKYTVYHSIGHTQYQVYVTLCGSLFGFARVVTRSKDRVTIEIVDHKNSAFADSAFNILLVGNNQIKN